MRFDPLSFVLGIGAGTGVSLIVWRARRRLHSVQETAESQIEFTRRFVGQSADRRYARDMVRYWQHRHMAGDLFELSHVLLEPRLLPPPPPLLPVGSEDVTSRDIFDVVPQFPDMPQCYAPFNVETMALDDLGSGDRHVAILAGSGQGKSTALVTLALMALGEVRFESLEDLSEQVIEEEEKTLTSEERKSRAEERQQMQERAMKKLHTAHEVQKEQLGVAVPEETLAPLNIVGLVPVLVHLADIELDETLYGKKKGEPLDPAEPLVRAAQRYVSSVTAQVTGSVIYPALERSRALILIDGYDELSPAARATYFYWLQQLGESYPNNLIVIAGPATGYEPLLALGFTPAFLRAWRAIDYDQLAARWSEVWQGDKKRRVTDDKILRRITIDNEGRTILEVSLKIWTGLADDARQAGRAGWYDAWAQRRLSTSEARNLLPDLALSVLEAGQPVLRSAAEGALAEKSARGGGKAVKTEGLLDTLVKDGVLRTFAGNRFDFTHAQVTSYLASAMLVEAGAERAAEVATAPTWQDAIGFAAAQIDLLLPIQRKLAAPPDLLYSELFELVRWLPDAPPDAPWRGDLFRRLAAAMVAPEQYPAVRERALAALIASRDKNVLYILRQALRSADADVRRLGCVGLGALGNAEAVNDLAAMLADENPRVKLAAALALGALGNDKAVEVMVQGLFQETHEIRRAIAEALAALPGEGHQILREGITAQEIEIRRASVYGLSRVRALWALLALYRAMLEDEQWYVRTAAEEAFLAAQSPEKDGPRKHPEADNLGWLIKWAADRGEGVPAGPNARQVLIRVLQEGQPNYKAMAAATLSRLGHVTALKPLYAALRDRDAGVRSAAYAALSDLQIRVGEPLPGLS